ncbi:hypothetical protein Q5P01_000204 [Channa striata]|uniref:Uncharacterized protein n=1 Tax=Channa striata TaxID=64152 RepID=A0AA88IJW8_CHASR|nr:hypothetical protein Q5P01_000204 [Channa striata]
MAEPDTMIAVTVTFKLHEGPPRPTAPGPRVRLRARCCPSSLSSTGRRDSGCPPSCALLNPPTKGSGSAVADLFRKVEPLTEAERVELRDGFEALGAKFAFTFKVKVSNWHVSATSLTLDQDRTNEMMHEAVDRAHRARTCISPTTIPAKGAPDVGKSTPPIPTTCWRRPFRDPSSMSDEEFDVWFTFRFDGSVRYDTRIDANPACPGDMISALSEGNAEEIWALMERTLCYFPLHACQRALEEHAKEFLRIVEPPSESTRAGADTGNSNFASAEASQSEPGSGGDVPCCESERPKEAEGRQRETHSSASEREAASAGYIRCQ